MDSIDLIGYRGYTSNWTKLESGVNMQPNKGKDALGWDPRTHYMGSGVAAAYDAERFSSLAGRLFQWLERRALLAAFRSVSTVESILDLPCGTGRLAESLLAEGYHVVGGDISAAMLEQARQRLARFGDRFTTEIVDARLAGQHGRRFDAALCARVLMHLPLTEQIEFLAGVTSAVHRYVVVTHSLDTAYQRGRRRVKRILGHQEPARYPLTELQLRKLLEGIGLHEIGRWRVNGTLSEAIVVLAERSASSASVS